MIDNLGSELMLLGESLRVRRQQIDKLDKRRLGKDDRLEVQRIMHKMDALRDDVNIFLRKLCNE